MSFRCDGCREAQPDKTRPVVVVVAQRRVKYSCRVWDDRREKVVEGTGLETVKEAKFCPSCAELVAPPHPKIALGPVKVVYS